MQRLLSIIVPTIDGREDSLARTLDAYERHTDHRHEIIVIKNLANWPTACNAGFDKAKGSLVHFGADDLEPVAGWFADAIKVASRDNELPAAFVHDHTPDGILNNAADGQPGETTHFTRVPLMTRKQWDLIGRWPEIDYYADVWLSEHARTLGIQTRLVDSYRFVHHWHQHGRLDSPERLARAQKELAEFRRNA